jgi:hypothetical protein
MTSFYYCVSSFNDNSLKTLVSLLSQRFQRFDVFKVGEESLYIKGYEGFKTFTDFLFS